MGIKINRITSFLVACLVLSGLSGCASNHEKNVNAANNRWKSMRSVLMLQMGQQQFEAGDLEQSEKTLTEAIKVDAENPELYTLAGRIAMERSQLERAYHRFKLSIEIDPQYAPAHYYQGIVMQRWMQFDAALVFYHRAFEIEPDNAAYLLAMAEMLVALDRMDEAMEVLTEKMTYFDLNAGIRMAIGQLFVMRGDYKHAVVYFRQASLIRSDDLHIHEELALALLAAGEASEAAHRLERLCEEPQWAHRRDLTRALGDAYFAAGRYIEAKMVYIKLTRSNPADVGTWIKLGELSMTRHDGQGAMLAAKRVIRLAPDRHEGFMLSGVVFSKEGRFEEAVDMFEKAASLAPDDATPVILRGITFEREGKLQAAAQAYREALRRQPGDKRARQLLVKVAAQAEQNVLTTD